MAKKKITKRTRAQKLANPAWRASIPTDQLPEKYRKMRERNATNKANAAAAANDPYAKVVQADTAQRYAPQEKAISGQKNASFQQQQNIDHWFDQYKQTVASAQAQTAQGYQQAGQQIDARANSAAEGPGGSPGAAQASASRRALTQSFGALMAGQGATQGAYLIDKGRIGEGERASQHVKEGGRLANINQALSDLQGEKGQYAITRRQQLEDAARKAALEDAAFGLNVQKAKDANENADLSRESSNANQKAQRDATARNQALTRAEARRKEALARKDKATAKDKKEEGRIKAKRQASAKLWGDVDAVKALIKNPKSVMDPKDKRDPSELSRAEVISLIRGDGAPEWAMTAAADIIDVGFIRKSHYDMLHAAGVSIPGKYRASKKNIPGGKTPDGIVTSLFG